ncbi:hypothetical protein HG535_0C00680 [Zygotorulaspora mrakii]|uniref:Las1p n=1 Tax=Zygotorulaspora mrakii TaxID=42260 RepID=A0A7H9B180_ZYGMR|nr:uncharacterized protein HG535_0C00680 [Zygotorulaspora mrakii]QLG71719.1 hypothetical protein HG535_0C00680 [Zygotorulaspora mrakii]
MVLPRIVPWANREELEELQKWFYPERTGSPNAVEGADCRYRAIQRVKCYQSRGSQHLPHVIDATAQISSSMLLDKHSSSSDNDNFPTRLSYTMSLIRFVNGLLDPTQQSQYAIPLHTLAQKVGVPSLFVDLRHEGTHEREMPSLEMLRYVAKQALAWLWDNYWNDDQLDESDDENISDSEDELTLELQQGFELGLKLVDLLEEYRWVWESNNINLISSENFVVEEKVKPSSKKERNLPPNEQINNYISKCKSLWIRCTDKSLFMERFLLNFKPTLLQLYIRKMKGFDQEFYSWMAMAFKKQIDGQHDVLKKKFPSWKSLERNLLLVFIECLDPNLVASQWASWDKLLERNVSFLTLWICESLKLKIDEHKSFHAHKRRKKKKQTVGIDKLICLLEERIAKLHKLSSSTDEKLYELSSSEICAANSTYQNTLQKNSQKTSDILSDLASLKERMKCHKPGGQDLADNLTGPKLWSRPTDWKPRPFGTL